MRFLKSPPIGRPWKRIIREHLLDVCIGICLGLFFSDLFDIGLLHIIQQLGGLAVIASFIVTLRRIYNNNKKEK